MLLSYSHVILCTTLSHRLKIAELVPSRSYYLRIIMYGIIKTGGHCGTEVLRSSYYISLTNELLRLVQMRCCNLYSQHISPDNTLFYWRQTLLPCNRGKRSHVSLPARASRQQQAVRHRKELFNLNLSPVALPDYLVTRCKYVRNRLGEFIGRLCVENSNGYIRLPLHAGGRDIGNYSQASFTCYPVGTSQEESAGATNRRTDIVKSSSTLQFDPRSSSSCFHIIG